MIYKFLRVLVGFALRMFFRKIYVTGTENIRPGKAQLIASNHPSGFMEPLLMACFFPKPLHFLVRGDVFDNKLLAPLLRATNQIPIFRFKDGFARLRENSHTIDESLEVLARKQSLLIFAEGNTESIKKLRPLQRGISRIAFQALEKYPDLDLEIVPVGINFTHPQHFDQSVMIRVGAPVKAADYLAAYHADKNDGHQKLLDDLYFAMKKNVVHLEDQTRKDVFEKLAAAERMAHPSAYPPVFVASATCLDREKLLAEKTDLLSENNLNNVRDRLAGLLSGQGRKQKMSDIAKEPVSLVHMLALCTGALPAAVGALIHGVPVAAGYLFTSKMVKHKEFRTSILMVSNIVLQSILYLILLILSVAGLLPWYTLPVAVTCGLWWRYFYTRLKDTAYLPVEKLADLKSKAAGILEDVKKM